MVVQIWRIGPEDIETAGRVKAAYDRLRKNPPKGYRIDTTDWSRDFEPEREYVYFVAGHSLDRPVGYAFCREKDPVRDIGRASCLYGIDNGRGLKNREGVKVDRGNLGQHPGYSAYTGQGGFLHLATLEVWVPTHASRLIRGIQETGPELIEAEVLADDLELFERNGFVDTGIDDRKEQMVLIWNNSRFKKVAQAG